jgi:hypothetical protein
MLRKRQQSLNEAFKTWKRKTQYVSTPAIKSKKPVFGQDTGKFKVSTTNVYDFIVETCGDGLPFQLPDNNLSQNFSQAAVTTNDVAVNYPKCGSDVNWAVYYHDVLCRTPEAFYTLNTRVPRPFQGTGWGWFLQYNTLRAMGVNYMWSEERGSNVDHYRRSYLSFKIDSCGFNCCDPSVFNTLCQQYGRVKQGPTSVTFHFMDVPVGHQSVKREYPVTNGSLASVGPATVEIRDQGAWMYIVIPPRKMASVKLQNLHGKANWDRLIDMGFKPRPMRKAHRIWCSNGGIDDQQMQHVLQTQEVAPTTENSFVAEDTLTGSTLSRRAPRPGKWIKHKSVETERACQYWQSAANDIRTALGRGTARSIQFQDLLAQGYDCCPFGSAIVFCFVQYHGGVPENARRQSIPIEIHVDSYTKFTQPLLEQLDLDQMGKNMQIDQ